MCRRGMKELDILLERFLDNHQAEIEQGAWPALETLLQREDDWLWDHLQRPAQTGDHDFDILFAAIRSSDA